MGDKDKERNTDFDRIKKLIDIMKENDLVELEISHDDDKILLKRSQPQQPVVTAVPMAGFNSMVAAQSQAIAGDTAGAKTAQAADEKLLDIKSPIIGTFYATPSPEAEPYAEIGTKVMPETVVCIIEAMKVMNEIKAEVAGTIVEVVVTSGQAVEYGQPLFRVRPD